MDFPSAGASRVIAFEKSKAREHTIVLIEMNVPTYVVAPNAAYCMFVRACNCTQIW
jgi:hypothetical protein